MYILHKMDTVNYNITDGELGGSLRNSVVTYLTPGSLHGSGVVPYLTPGSRQQSVGPVVGVSAPVGSVDSVAAVDLLNIGRVDGLS